MTVKITIAGVEHELSAEEAKAVYEQLAKLFGRKPFVVKKEYADPKIHYTIPREQGQPPPKTTPYFTCQ